MSTLFVTISNLWRRLLSKEANTEEGDGITQEDDGITQEKEIKAPTLEQIKQDIDLRRDVIEKKYYTWQFENNRFKIINLEVEKLTKNMDGLPVRYDYDSTKEVMLTIYENAIRREITKYQIQSKEKTKMLFFDILKNVLNKSNELVETWMRINEAVILTKNDGNVSLSSRNQQETLLIRRNELEKSFNEIRGGDRTSTGPNSTRNKPFDFNITEASNTNVGLTDILTEVLPEKETLDDYTKILKTWCDGANSNDVEGYMTNTYNNAIKFRLAALTQLDDTGNDLLVYDRILPYEKDLHINDFESHFEELRYLIKLWWQALYNGFNKQNKHSVFQAFMMPILLNQMEEYEKNLEASLKSSMPFGTIENFDDYDRNVRKTIKLFNKLDRLTALPSENITNTVMHGPILSYVNGWCIGESASPVQQAMDLCRLICEHTLEFRLRDPAFILHKLFLGWEHSTIRASRRTVHAILCGSLRDQVLDHYDNSFYFKGIDPKVKESNQNQLEKLLTFYNSTKYFVIEENDDVRLVSITYHDDILIQSAKKMNKNYKNNPYYVNPATILQNIYWLLTDQHNIFWFSNGILQEGTNEREAQKNKWLKKFNECVFSIAPNMSIKQIETRIKKMFAEENLSKLDASVLLDENTRSLLLESCKKMTNELHPYDENNLLDETVLENIIWLNNNEHNIFWFNKGELQTTEEEQKKQKKTWLEKFATIIDKVLTEKIEHLDNKIKEIKEKQPKNKINYELLQSLKETPANNLPPLVSYAPVVIHGPRPNAVATQCLIQEILILTEEGKRMKNLLESTVEDVMKTSRVTSTPVGCLAYEHRNERRQHKRVRTTIDFDRILDHWKLNLTVVVSTMNNLQLTHSLSSDAGRIQRNMHSLENLKLQLALSVKQLIYTVPPKDDK